MRGERFPAFAAGVALLAVIVVFFPTLFFGRVISPLDTVANAPPWRVVHPPVEVANPDLEEAATAVLPLQLMARRTGFATAIWNPGLACGGPGWLVWSAGILSPTVAPLVPWIDEARLAGGIVLLRLLLAFAGSWLLLRRSGLSEGSSAVGAAAYALSGPMIAGWLWPVGGTMALLPFALWGLDRALDRHRAKGAVPLAGLCWLLFLAGGAPGATVGGFWLAAAWVVWRVLSSPPGERPGTRRLLAVGLSVAAGTAILTPSIVLWWRSATGWGLLDAPAAAPGLGLRTFRMLLDPFLFGDPRTATFTPPAGLESLGFHGLCLAMGPVALALAVLGAFRRWRDRPFWTAVAAVILAAIAWAPAARAVRLLPGLGHVVPFRFAPSLALALAALAAGGWESLERLAPASLARLGSAGVVAAIVLGQGLLGGHLTTALRPAEARLDTTPSLDWLAARAGPGERLAPLFQTLPPDTAAALGFADIRSRFASLEGYRRLIRTIDPQSWDPRVRQIVLNGATIDLFHPYLAALGARWILEPPAYHLVEYALGEHTLDTGPRRGTLGPLRKGLRIEQEVTLPGECSRLGLNLAVRGEASVLLDVRLLAADGRPVGRWRLGAGSASGGALLWIDLPARRPPGPSVLQIRCLEGHGPVSLWTCPRPLESGNTLTVGGRPRRDALVLSLDVSGYAMAHEGPGLRIWENRRALPLLWTVGRTAAGSVETLIEADPPLDLGTVAVVDPAVRDALPPLQRGVVGSIRADGAVVRALVNAPGETLLVSSIPASPSVLAVEIDGRRVAPLTVNGLFLGAVLPAGRHEVTIHPVLPAWQWGLALAGCGILAVLAMPWWRRRETA